MSEPITEEQLQFRRDVEPIIKRFRRYSITMRDTMTELETVFTTQLTAVTAENERLREALKIIRRNTGVASPYNKIATAALAAQTKGD